MFIMLFFSVAMMVASVAVAWIVVARLPEDYFQDPCQRRSSTRTGVRAALVVLKNICGVLVFLSGVAMLFLPGQGVLTMLVGVLIMDFPGKYRLERALVSRQAVRRAMNWMRARWGAPPLRW